MIDDKLKHIAIIMDGNGRWAEARGQKRSMGHKAGAVTLEKLALHAKKIGLKFLSVYAFSTDNFKRSKEEVDFLMDLLVEYFTKKMKKLIGLYHHQQKGAEDFFNFTFKRRQKFWMFISWFILFKSLYR